MSQPLLRRGHQSDIGNADDASLQQSTSDNSYRQDRWSECQFSLTAFLKPCCNFFSNFFNASYYYISRHFRLIAEFIFGTNSPSKLLDTYENQYGKVHPEFFIGSFQEAISKAYSSKKILVAYIHNDLSISTDYFCSNTLKNDYLITFLNSNAIFWLVDFWDMPGHKVAKKLKSKQYPHVSFLVPLDSQNSKVVNFLENRLEAQDLVDGLLFAMNHITAEEQKNNEYRSIREQQDREYKEAERQDKLKECQRVEEACRQENEKKEVEKQQQLKAEVMNRREIKSKVIATWNVLDINAENKDKMTSVCVRLPSGAKIQRVFWITDPLIKLRDWVETSQFLYPDRNDIEIPENFDLQMFRSDPIDFSNEEVNFKDADLFPSAVLYLTSAQSP